MARKTKTDLISALRQMEKVHEPTAEAQALAALGDPLLATKKLSEAIEKWKATKPEELFASEQDYLRFVNTCNRQLGTQILLTMIVAVAQLEVKLKDVTLVSAKDLSSITSELGRQLALLRKDEPSIPQTVEDLDKQLAEMEAKFTDVDPDAPRH